MKPGADATSCAPPQERRSFFLRAMATCRLMILFMNKRFWRLVLVAGTAVILAGCGNKETKEALQKAAALGDQKQYQDANNVLVEALQTRCLLYTSRCV